MKLAIISLLSLSSINARGFQKPFWMLDHYDHKEQHNWNNVYDLYKEPEFKVQALESDPDNAGQKLRDILSDPSYVVIDVREIWEKPGYHLVPQIWDHENREKGFLPEIGPISAKLTSMKYNDIKINPFELITTVSEASDISPGETFSENNVKCCV